MDSNASRFAYSASTGQDTITFHSEIPGHNTYDGSWEVSCPPYTLHDQMEWLSGNHGQLFLPGQDYLTSLQQSQYDPGMAPFEQQSSTQCYGPQTELVPAPQPIHSLNYGKQGSTSSMTADNNAVARPSSTDTMLDSGSSTTSRPSSITSSPSSRSRKLKVPAITTQFENNHHETALSTSSINDGIQVAPDADSMTVMSSEWMHVHDNSGQNGVQDQSMGAVAIKASPALLEPFQWQSPGTRRTSVSSSISGPVFSPYGTPSSATWQSTFNSPYSQQQNWGPIPNSQRISISPQTSQMPRGYGSLGRSNSNYLEALRQGRHTRQSAMSLPSRNKPRLVRNITDGFGMASGNLTSPSRTRSAETRMRLRGDMTMQPGVDISQQLALPAFQLGTFFTSPDACQSEFSMPAEVHTPARKILPSSTTHTPMAPPQTTPRATLTPNLNSLNLSTPYSCSRPFPHLPTNAPPCTSAVNPIPTPAHQPPLPVPSEPPLSDFNTNNSHGPSSSPTNCHGSACGPIRQSPHFEGDIYTPRYKRRNAAGKWEGWCGYCQPGRWLDLKNSRYWEDKLRNHGICARTKTFFEGPIRVRWVSDRGTIWEGEVGDSGFDIEGKDVSEDDGVGRKREGLCGECNSWVGMDGMRSRGKGRCVAWWMHAYKCHEQSRSRNDGA